MSTPATRCFALAPYGPDAVPVGITWCTEASLSGHWLEVATRFLDGKGTSFRAAWDAPLSLFETRLTSGDGVGLGSFYAAGQPTSSHLYLTGEVPPAEAEVTALFIDSLRKVRFVQSKAGAAAAFAEVAGYRERPLHVQVSWPRPDLPVDVSRTAADLGRHFAAAFLFKRLAARV